MDNKPFILGVAGGSCSGKTTFAKRLVDELGIGKCLLVYQDDFYKDQSDKFDYDGGSINFDHPDSIDFTLLAEKLLQLKENQKCHLPQYDFATHKRHPVGRPVDTRPLIIVDGILVLHHQGVRELLDYSLYFEETCEVRFERRLKRDVAERGRTPEGVQRQFDKQVEPMHQEFVRPSREHASTIVSGAIEDSIYHAILSSLPKF